MTDGILLAEIQRDRRLLRYDTLILDEAHERSLNIDFLLGYLRELLPRRPDLKVIVTSATIEPGRFAAHFGGAPIVEVSGRTYPGRDPLPPTGSRTSPVDDADDPDDPDHEIVRTEVRDQTEAIVDAVRELEAEPPGDVLVFLSGEREIRDTAEALRGALGHAHRGAAALRAAADRRAAEGLRAATRGRRVVLATNVAETSLTVPGIRYVVDPGTARISRYSRRTKVQRLPIEPISQASAAQRAGRSGRTAPGVCIRLYSEEDFELAAPLHRSRDPAHQPRRGHPADGRAGARRHRELPVPRSAGRAQHPRRRAAAAGTRRVRRRAARITESGRRLAQLPLDPRIGRMILAADAEGCVREVLVLAAALSIPDPRERPDRPRGGGAAEARPVRRRALRLHAPTSTCGATCASSARSGRAAPFRRMCREEFLHYLRIREWQDLTGQLRSIARDLGIRESDDRARRPGAASTPRCSPGCCRTSACARATARDYAGARNSKFVLAPGLGADQASRRAGSSSPIWSRPAGSSAGSPRASNRRPSSASPAHLVQRTYSEPHWDAKRGAVMAYERVTLYGLPLVPRRRVGYAQVDPAAGPRAVHPARAGRGRLADPAPLLPRQRRAARGTGRAGGARPPPRPAGRRRRDLRLLRRARARRGGVGAALRRVVEEAAAPHPGPADVHPRRSAAQRRRRRPARTPGRPATCRCR